MDTRRHRMLRLNPKWFKDARTGILGPKTHSMGIDIAQQQHRKQFPVLFLQLHQWWDEHGKWGKGSGCVLVYFPLAVIKTPTKGNFGGEKGLFTGYSPSWRETKTGTQGRNENRNLRVMLSTGFLFLFVLSQFLYGPGPPAQGWYCLH